MYFLTSCNCIWDCIYRLTSSKYASFQRINTHVSMSYESKKSVKNSATFSCAYLGFIFRFGRGESAEGSLIQKRCVCLFLGVVHKLRLHDFEKKGFIGQFLIRPCRQKKSKNKTCSTIIRDFRVDLELVVGFGEKDTIGFRRKSLGTEKNSSNRKS